MAPWGYGEVDGKQYPSCIDTFCLCLGKPKTFSNMQSYFVHFRRLAHLEAMDFSIKLMSGNMSDSMIVVLMLPQGPQHGTKFVPLLTANDSHLLI